MAIKEKTIDITDRNKVFNNPLTPPPIRAYKQQQDEKGDFLTREANTAPTEQERESAQKTRQIFNDIRPIRTAAAIMLALLFMGAGAQTTYAQVGADPLRFVVSPEVPGPSQRVTIEAQGVGTFLGDATITWQQNGTTVASGAGTKTFSFTTGGLGVTTRIHVIINSPSQGQFAHDFVFTPTLVNLFWEAQTSVPPLYQGKALYSPGSTVRVIALPQVVANGATVTSNNLSFQWSVGGQAVPEQSGKGKTSLTFIGSQLREGEQVSVDVYFGTALVGRSSIFIPATAPQVLLYTKDPLRGVLYDQALPSSVSLAGQEITLRAEPYYFANESLAGGAVSYDWTLNGEKTSGPDSAQGILTLRQTGTGTGEGQLTVELQNTDSSKFIQSAQAALRLIFGGTTSNNSGGFGI